MKNLKYLFLALILCMPVFVNAAEPVSVTDQTSLASCVIVDGNVCELKNDIDVTSTINVNAGATVTIKLGEYDINSTVSGKTFYVTDGTIKVEGSGTITAPGDVFYLEGNTVTGGAKRVAAVEIGEGVSVVSNTSNCIWVKGNGAKATVNGNLEAKGVYAAIQGNGTLPSATVDNGNTEIIINSPAVIKAVTGAIYNPQNGTVVVNGGTITAKTGIEMRAGHLTINGGTIISTATETTITSNGNGSSVEGAAVAVAQHTTLQEASITVNAGTLSGPTALVEATPEDPSNSNVVSLAINGGIFETTIANGTTIDSENKTEFISGGTFIGGVESGYVSTEGDLVFGNDKDGNLVILDYAKVNALGEKLKKLGLDKYQTAEDLKKDYTAKSVDALMAVAKKQEDISTQAELDAWVEEMEKAIDSLKLIAENPDTADNILVYLACASVAIVGLSAAVIFKKRYN